MARLSDVADDSRIRTGWPALAQALAETASPQVRNMATIGGNLLQRTRCLYFRDTAAPCNKRQPGSGCGAWDGQNRINAVLGGSRQCIAAYPGDMAVALTALDAELVLHGPDGERRIKAGELHREPGGTPHVDTTLRRGEIITAITLSSDRLARRSCFVKVRDRATFEWALASAAVALALDNGRVSAVRIVAGGVATRPWRLPRVERKLAGRALDLETVRRAAQLAAEGAEPRPGNAFKVPLLCRVVERAVLKAGGLA
jgi:xanthine dehydrogenase YagS FAD-binding subunit